VTSFMSFCIVLCCCPPTQGRFEAAGWQLFWLLITRLDFISMVSLKWADLLFKGENRASRLPDFVRE
jgi:hypothetical protein